MKKTTRILLSFLLTFCLILGLGESSTFVRAASATGKSFSFTSADGTCTVTLTEYMDNQWWYEYYISIKNNGTETIKKWTLNASVSDTSKLSASNAYNAKLAVGSGSMTLSGLGLSLNIAPGQTFSGSDCKIGAGGAVSFSQGSVSYTTPASSGSGKTYGTGQTTLDDFQLDYTLTGQPQSGVQTPFDKHGKLHVSGTQLTDSHGQATILQGVSTHGLQWDNMGDYVNETALSNLRDEWGADLIRLVGYVTQNGYTVSETGRQRIDTYIQKGVSLANKLGMYAMIDWHIHAENPMDTKSAAISFFDTYSKKYADDDHVIYEICNEPSDLPWSTIKSYAQDVVSTIRANDPDGIIVVGTGNWSQNVDQIQSGGGMLDASNIMYSFHFYAATHGQNFRDKVTTAHNQGIPIYVTEFGTCTADGQSNISPEDTKEWLDFLRGYGISYSAWSLCNKNEAASLISPASSKTSGWTGDDLAGSGAIIVQLYRGYKAYQGENTQTPAPATQTPIPTNAPSQDPAQSGSPVPTNVPSQDPTQSSAPATQTPAITPTQSPVQSDSPVPTNVPSQDPTQSSAPATQTPAITPTQSPVQSGSPVPTNVPSQDPTHSSAPAPTNAPSQSPTRSSAPVPTNAPSQNPAQSSAPVPTNTNTPGSAGTPNTPPVFLKPSVRLKRKKLTVKKGKKVRIQLRNKTPDDKILRFRIKNKKIVKVNKKGVVTGLKKGKTVVTVIMKNGARLKCKIIVK